MATRRYWNVAKITLLITALGSQLNPSTRVTNLMAKDEVKDYVSTAKFENHVMSNDIKFELLNSLKNDIHEIALSQSNFIKNQEKQNLESKKTLAILLKNSNEKTKKEYFDKLSTKQDTINWVGYANLPDTVQIQEIVIK